MSCTPQQQQAQCWVKHVCRCPCLHMRCCITREPGRGRRPPLGLLISLRKFYQTVGVRLLLAGSADAHAAASPLL